MAANKSQTTSWIYDIECYINMFEVSFIPYGVPQDIIDLYIELDASISFGEFLRNTRELDLELSDIQKEDHSHYDAEVVPFTVTIRSKTSRTQDDILSIIRRMEGIKYFEVI